MEMGLDQKYRPVQSEWVTVNPPLLRTCELSAQVGHPLGAPNRLQRFFLSNQLSRHINKG